MKYTVVIAAFLVLAAACSSGPATMPVSIDVSSIARGITARDLVGPGQDGVITLTVTDENGDLLASKSVSLDETEIEIAVPPGPARTFTLQVTDPTGVQVFFTASFTADLVPGGVTNYQMKIEAAVDVTPKAVDLPLGQSTTFTAVSSDGNAVDVTWMVNGETGGTEAFGYISETNPAVYTAPTTMPQGGMATITALYVDDTGKTMIGGATVTLLTNANLPAILSFSPLSGTPGTPVTIAGEHFGSRGTVLFGGAPADTVRSWTDTEIVALVPDGAVTGAITVQTAGGRGESALTFTVVPPPPEVIGFSPAQGPAGTPVTIIGANFGTDATGTKVSFGGTAVTTVYSWSDTEIRTAVPEGAAAGKIAVTTRWGTADSAAEFTVTPSPPVVTAISPRSGRAGTAVTITGTHFGDGSDSAVTFNGAAGAVTASTTAWSDTVITAIAPEGVATGAVSVTTPYGTSTSVDPFSVMGPAPVISGLTPPVMSDNSAGFTLTIDGKHFSQDAAVHFGTGLPVTTRVSEDQLTAAITAVMAGTAGDVDLTVVNFDGSPSNKVTYTIVKGAAVAVPGVTITKRISGGQTGIPVTVTVNNTGEAPASVTGAQIEFLTATGGSADADFTVVPQFTTPVAVPGGGSVRLTYLAGYAANPASTGQITITCSVAAADGYSGAALAAAAGSAVFTAEAGAAVTATQVSVSASKASKGQTVPVSVTFRNDGTANSSVDSASLMFSAGGVSRNADFTATTRTPLPAVVNGKGGTLTVQFDALVHGTAQSGAVTVDAQASVTDMTSQIPATVQGAAATGTLAVQSPAALVVTSVTLSKAVVNTGMAGLSLTATLQNNGEADATLSTLAAVFKDGASADRTGDYTVGPADTYPKSIAGGKSATLQFNVAVKPSAATGVITAGVTGSALDVNTGGAAAMDTAATTSWLVQNPASVNVLSVSAPGTVHIADTGIPLTVAVENNGDAAARVTGVSITVTDQSSADVTAQFAPVLQTLLPVSVAGQSTSQFSFLFDVKAAAPIGTVKIDAAVGFTDEVSLATGSRSGAQVPASVAVRHKLMVVVAPSSGTTYAAGATIPFTATVKDESDAVHATGVTWTVEGGLPAEVGTIDSGGVYSPPAKAIKTAATVRATSIEDSSYSATAAVTIKHVLTVSVTPPAQTAYMGGSYPFSAVVKDEIDAVHATGVTWAVEGGLPTQVGTITSGGVYSPPAVYGLGAATVRATSSEDSSFSGTAAVAIKHSYTVSVSPPSTTIYIQVENSPIPFTATVFDEASVRDNGGVTWTVEGGTPQQVGSIDPDGTYWPPYPMTISSATIRATGKTDSTFSGTAVVTFKHTLTVTVSPNPAGAHSGTPVQFTATVEDESRNTHGTGVTWSLVETGNVGTIDSGTGLFTPPTGQVDPTVTVRAVSKEDATFSGTAGVSLFAGPVSLSFDGTPERLNPGAGYAFMASANQCGDCSLRWYVNDVLGGDATNGTVDASGSYVAPINLPPTPTVTVKAVSVEQPSVDITAEFPIAMGTYLNRFDIQVDENQFNSDGGANPFTITNVGGTGTANLGYNGYTVTVDGCGAGCDRIDLNVYLYSNDSMTNWQAVLAGWYALPSGFNSAQQNQGTTTGPVGCKDTASYAVPDVYSLNPSYFTLSWDRKPGAPTYTVTTEVAYGLPLIYNNGPLGGALNDPVVIHGLNLGGGAAAADGNFVAINGFTVPDGSVTAWSSGEIDFVVPVGVSSGPLVVNVAGFPAIYSGIPFTFGQHVVLAGGMGVYGGGDFWVTAAEDRIFFDGGTLDFQGVMAPKGPAFGAGRPGLYTDTIPAVGMVAVNETGSRIDTIYVSGANMFYSFQSSIWLKSAADLGSGSELVNSYDVNAQYGMAAVGNNLFYPAQPEGYTILFGDYTTTFSPSSFYSPAGSFNTGMDATPDGKVVYSYNNMSNNLAWLDSATQGTSTDIVVGAPAPYNWLYRAFWLNAAGDTVLFQFDDGTNGPGIYRQAIVSGTPAKVLPLDYAGTAFTAAVVGTKLYYMVDDNTAGYTVLKWQEIGGAGSGLVAHVQAAGNVPYRMRSAGTHLYYGCYNGSVCRIPLVP